MNTMLALDLQRIVDGELNHQQRAEFLQSLGNDSEQWRTLALALLEEQQWAREIRWDAMKTAASPAPSVPGATIELAGKHAANGVSASRRFSSFGSTNWFTALAASALLCIGITGGMAYRSSQTVIPKPDAVATSASPRSSDSMRLVLSGPDQRQTEIPLVNANEIDPREVMANDAYEIAKLNQQLRGKGYRLDVQPQIYSGRLDDGRQVVVPIHNVALKSVGL